MHESNRMWVTLEVGKSIEQRPIIAHRFIQTVDRPC